MKTEPITTRLTRAKLALSVVEDEVDAILSEIGLTLSDWDDWHYDPYDDELVIEGSKPLDDEQRSQLMRHGFKPRFILKPR